MNVKKPLFSSCVLGCFTLLMASVGFSQTISRIDVVQGVQKGLEQVVAGSASGLKVSTVFYRQSLELSDGEVIWQIGSDADQLKAGRQSVPVTVLVNGVPETKISVLAVIKRFLEVPVVSRSISRGETVASEDIKWQEIEMVRPIDGLVRDEEDIIGKVAVRTIREGTALRSKWFDAPLAVERGEQVRVQLVRGGLVIRTTAIALDKGRIGDMVPLRNAKSHVRYEARVFAPGQARVQTW
ncbi:MAG: flagellar basal body P-ring formation protein FlgA [Magnetococcales bacterium]|nr:flagellar basal body P-ring formation protein FlgA [Magnetococcales bacterium]